MGPLTTERRNTDGHLHHGCGDHQLRSLDSARRGHAGAQPPQLDAQHAWLHRDGPDDVLRHRSLVLECQQHFTRFVRLPLHDHPAGRVRRGDDQVQPRSVHHSAAHPVVSALREPPEVQGFQREPPGPAPVVEVTIQAP